MSLLTQFAQNSGSYGSSMSDSAAIASITAIIFIFIGVMILITYVVTAFLTSRIFKKAGVEQWIAWVPIYSTWKTLELGNEKGFWSLLVALPLILTFPLIFVEFSSVAPSIVTFANIVNNLLGVVSLVGYVFLYIAMYRIGLKLQKEGWFVLLAIFIPIVWYIWLAFDGSKWKVPTDTITPTGLTTPIPVAQPTFVPAEQPKKED